MNGLYIYRLQCLSRMHMHVISENPVTLAQGNFGKTRHIASSWLYL